MQLKKTKIVCTIGPSSWDYATLKELARAGMNVARLNFSHGTHEEKKEQIGFLRKISTEIDKPLAVMADLQGPKIRLGEIEGRREIKKGEKINLSLRPEENELPMVFDLSPFVKKGQRIFLNDGLVELHVLSVKGKVIEAEAQNDGWVSSHKGVNVPDTRIREGVFTPKDAEDAEFALSQGVDYLAVSFIQSVEDLEPAKKLIKKISPTTKLVVKLEKNEAVADLEDIIKATDVIMVARGDLAIEANAPEVPIIQQKIIKLARQNQKPVIVATQMLESMIENPRPTRAETSDVANAVLDQVDAVMLSAESASGKYPVEAVKTMKNIILAVEQHPDYSHYIKINWENLEENKLSQNALAASAASLAYRTGAKAIVVASATGTSALRVSSFRPNVQIIAVTHDQSTCNKLAVVWGIKSVVVKPSSNFDTFWNKITESIKETGFVKKGDTLVYLSGATVGLSGATDTLKIVTI